MIKVENIEIFGLDGAMRGMRNPLNSWDKADTTIYQEHGREFINVGVNDLNLATRLIKAGTEHRKFLRMIHVQMDVIAPLYWWKEADTYKVGTTTNSCSTMHKIASKVFTIDDFSHEHLMDEPIYTHDGIDSNEERIIATGLLDDTIFCLNVFRRKFLETKDKKYWWQMIQLLPSSYNQRRTWDISMETLLSILHQRKNHKLDEWNKFREIFLEQVPYVKEFYEASLKENNNENSQN